MTRSTTGTTARAAALITLAAIAGCGGGTTAEPGGTGGGGTGGGEVSPPTQQQRSGATPGEAVQRCGPEASYVWVARKFRCPEGSNPFSGDAEAAARARAGNIGAGPDGHILDDYVVPCGAGPVHVYVDMYHCASGQTPF